VRDRFQKFKVRCRKCIAIVVIVDIHDAEYILTDHEGNIDGGQYLVEDSALRQVFLGDIFGRGRPDKSLPILKSPVNPCHADRVFPHRPVGFQEQFPPAVRQQDGTAKRGGNRTLQVFDQDLNQGIQFLGCAEGLNQIVKGFQLSPTLHQHFINGVTAGTDE